MAIVIAATLAWAIVLSHFRSDSGMLSGRFEVVRHLHSCLTSQGVSPFIGALPLLMFRCKYTTEEHHAKPVPLAITLRGTGLPRRLSKKTIKNLSTKDQRL